jgi:histidinol-phosphate aminotransferase
MIYPKKHLFNLAPYKMPAGSRKEKIRLDLNENLAGCSPKVLEAIRRMNPEEIAMYPETDMLIEKIASHNHLAPENIMVTNGGDDAIRCIIDTYVDNQECAIIASPSYTMFRIMLQQNNARVVEVLYDQDFSFPIRNFLSAIGRGARLAVIVNPGNPIGTILGEDDLRRILVKTHGNDVVMVLDETYYHFCHKTNIELVKEFDNLIVMQTFSKAYGLTGLRLGYIASNRANIEQMSKINLPFPVNAVAIYAALAALEDHDHVEKVVQEIEREKKFLFEELHKLGLDVLNSDINFLLVKLDERSTIVHQQLAERGILVKNLNSFPVMKGYLRITIGTRKQHELLLHALHEILNLELYMSAGCSVPMLRTE